MKITPLRLPEVLLIEPDCFSDERGFFLESYRHSRYLEAGISCAFVQDNVSFSHKNVLRGMHFQKNGAQAKLVSVIVGTIYDVAVDIRPTSRTFGHWAAQILDDQTHCQLFIPEGFAHGFCVLSDFAHVTYKVSAPFLAEKEKSFRFDDPNLAIAWPVSSPILSKRDREAPFFNELFALEPQ